MSSLVSAYGVLMLVLAPVARAATPAEVMRHPKTGAPGVWVSGATFKKLDLWSVQGPQLKAAHALRKQEVASLRLSLRAMTVTATTAQADRDRLTAENKDLWAKNDVLRERLLDAQDPWWSRVLLFSLGAAVTIGVAYAVKPAVQP